MNNHSVFAGLRRIITKEDRPKLAFGLILGVFGGFVELAGVAGLYPLLAILSRPEVIETNRFLARLKTIGGFSNDRTFILAFGALSLGVFIFSATFLFLRQAYLTHFSLRQIEKISARLLRSYLERPYAYFLDVNSAELTKNVIAQTDALANGMLLPWMTAFSEFFVLTGLAGLILWMDPTVGIAAVVVLGGMVAVIQLALRQKIHRLGRLSDEANGRRLTFCIEALQSVKEIKAADAESYFCRQFSGPAAELAAAFTKVSVILLLPPFLIQVAAVSAMMALALGLIALGRPFAEIVPLLSVYAVAGYRLMPSMSRLSTAFGSMRQYRSVFDNVCAVLSDAEPRAKAESRTLEFRERLELRNVRFAYPGPRGGRNVLEDLDLTIERGTLLALVGGSGAGKTTLVDLILGLLRPNSGDLCVDGRVLTPADMPAWRSRIGYIPQSLFLSDTSIASNIAFGVPEEEIDMRRVERVVSMARLDEMIAALPEGVRTRIGERGSKLSGGQRQRLGIARALYSDPDVLILDEPTSALDGITERTIVETLQALKGSKTIITIAHRETTIRDSDRVVLLRGGRIEDSGRFEELIARNRNFAALMAHAAAPGTMHENPA